VGGGTRVPFIARWPGQIPAGKVSDELGMTIDLLPTFANLIGAKLPDHKIDGLDIWPFLAAEPGAKNPHDAYFFYGVPFGQWTGAQLEAVRSGHWKLVLPHTYRTLGTSRPVATACRPNTSRGRLPKWSFTTWRKTSARSTT